MIGRIMDAAATIISPTATYVDASSGVPIDPIDVAVVPSLVAKYSRLMALPHFSVSLLPGVGLLPGVYRRESAWNFGIDDHLPFDARGNCDST